MRNIYWYQLSLVVLLFTVISGRAFSQDFPEKPVPPRLVNDFAGMLSTQEADVLERKLVAFNDSTSTQIAIVIVTTLNGYDKADYAQRLAELWGIGQKGLDNGVLILVKPKTPDSRGEVQITQGYGLEGAIPDITCAEIVDYEILPSFIAGDYFGGLNNATNTLMALASGEYSAEEYGQKSKKGEGVPLGLIIFIIFIIIAVISGRKGGSNSKNISSGGLPLWVLLSMMNSGRGSHRGSWGGFSGGSGGGGGGFGGFGGGSFGGGGAGGSW